VFSLAALFLFTFAANANPTLQEFTSTRSVTSMVITKDGMLWVGTRGGILTRDAAGKWTKQTTKNGLPSNEVGDISVSDVGTVKVLFPNAAAIWTDGKWQVDKSTFIAPRQYQFPKTQWKNKTVQADWNGLQMGDRHIEIPPSKGSYISALLPQGKVLLVAVYGDGIWSFDGNNWQKLYSTLPTEARQITALASDPATKVLFAGTRRAGVWMFDGKKWQQHLQDNEPYNNDIQSLISFQGNIFAGTLEDGLMEYRNGKWRHFGKEILSSNAPRQMAVFHDHLYVRFGNGMVDRFDGKKWERNIFPDLPRGKIYSLATDDRKLFLGQWGGWSEWDGKSFQHFLKLPELQGVPLMVLHPIGNSLWIGTQSLGLMMYSHRSAKLRLIDARRGLPDDWITAIAGNTDDNVFTGTFVGGLARKTVSGWQTVTPVAGENVTALEMDDAGGIYIATRHGVWHQSASGIWQNYQQTFPALSPEAQALLRTPEGLWIGTRAGLFLISLEAQSRKE
jgi:ligand-binding sensor domain-containing protein